MNNVRLLEMSKKQSTSKRGKWQVMLNDDMVNTFEHVIECLIDICGHNYYQAVQCANITHTVKTCSIYVDTWDMCEDVAEALTDEGLNVSITKV
jgi:ATP-dependent Clp protease adaptor protein ClpS